MAKETCKDSDPNCVHCAGKCTREAEVVLFRVDMGDATGTEFCEPCADDALETGVFRCPTATEWLSDQGVLF